MNTKPFIAVVDPAGHTPELACFNNMVHLAPCRLHYHLPALHGLDSLFEAEGNLVGVVVLGSSTSVPDAPPWQAPLFDWLWDQAVKYIPVLGICYGHQLIAAKLGGQVEFIDPVNKAKQIGFREIICDATPFLPQKVAGPMVVSHREVVTSIPRELKVYAQSSMFPYEGLVHETLPVWTVQPHPEATRLFMRNQSIPLPESAHQFNFGHQFVESFMTFCFQRSLHSGQN